MVVVPIVVCAVCFAAGAVASARWLPALAQGAVGGMAFLVVCGLVGAAVGLAGLNIYAIVRNLEDHGFGLDDSRVLTDGLVILLRDSGTVFGLAAVVYLLAPAREEQPTEGGLPTTSVQAP